MTEQIVEDMEECVLCSCRGSPFLYVVDYEHIERLVKGDKVIDGIVLYSGGVLLLEYACGDI